MMKIGKGHDGNGDAICYDDAPGNRLRQGAQGKAAPAHLSRANKATTMHKYDAFICHATEDKEDFVRPLAKRLTDAGCKIWYDEFSMEVGDSLRRSIDRGLIDSRFGIVILSPSFFAKQWTQRELDGLVSKEMEGRKVILPIWHKVSWDDVNRYSPPLADKLALKTAEQSMDEIVASLVRVLNPDIPPDAGKRERTTANTSRPEAPGTPAQPQPQPDAPQGVEWEWVIPLRYHDVGAFANGLAPVKGKWGRWWCINEKGEDVTPAEFDEVGDCAANGLARVNVEGEYGYINAKGEFVILPTFEDAQDFAANGLAVVEMEGKQGYINAKGEFVIPPTFENAWDFAANGLARVRAEKKYGYIKKYGYTKYVEKYGHIQYGYINAKGELVIPPTFEDAWDFAANGLARVEMEGKQGYINAKGGFVIEPNFGWAGDFAANGLAVVEMEGKWGYINAKGEEVIPLRYSSAGDFAANGLAPVKMEGKWGYINAKGEEVIPLRYSWVGDFAANGLAVVRVEGKWGYINARGEEVIPLRYSRAEGFAANGLAAVEVEGKWGYIRYRGK
jgi:hypothetical protein